MNASVILVVVMVTMAFAFALEQAMRRVKDLRKRVTNLVTKRQQQVERLRAASRESLMLRREIRNLRRTSDLLTDEIAQVDAELLRLAHPANRTFVIDEKRAPTDAGWMVTVEAPLIGIGRHAPTWTGQRRFRVWATDDVAARAKIERRYGPDLGYSIISTFPAPPPVANRNSDPALASG